MTGRYARGALPPAQIDGGWPNQVQIACSAGKDWAGFYNGRLDWLRARSFACKQRSIAGTSIRFCFADIETASAFQAAFGGEMIVVEPKLKKLQPWLV
jgi:hypothetical protein